MESSTRLDRRFSPIVDPQRQDLPMLRHYLQITIVLRPDSTVWRYGLFIDR